MGTYLRGCISFRIAEKRPIELCARIDYINHYHSMDVVCFDLIVTARAFQVPMAIAVLLRALL